MLIYSDRYRGWGKQKPRQWGSLAALKGAVRRNCDRLGLPEPIGYWPLWEKAGNTAHDIFGTHSGTIGSAMAWQNTGIKGPGYSNANGYINCGSDIDPRGWDSIVVVYSGLFIKPPNNHQYPGLVHNVTSGEYFGQYAITYETNGDGVEGVYMQFGGTSANIGTSGTALPGKETTLVGAWDKANIRGYWLGDKQFTTASTIDWQAANNPTYIGGYFRNSVWRTSYNRHDQVIIFGKDIFKGETRSDEIAELFMSAPYALLQPISTPYIFDLGATTGTTVTIYADSRARISNSFFKTADTLAGISNIGSLFADTLSGVSNTRDISADTLTGVSNTEFEVADSQVGVSNVESRVADYLAAISNSRSRSADSKTRISNLRSILADSLAQISNARSILADTLTIARNIETSTADSNISVSNEIARLIDTSVQIGVEGTVTVSFDTLAKISNVLSITGDTKQAISNTLAISGDSKSAISTSQSVNSDSKTGISNTQITEADCKAIISELFSTTADSKLSISNTTITEADTRAIISGLTQVIAYCDTSLSVSNIDSVLADLKVFVGPSGITLSTADIDAIANAVLAKLTGNGLSADDIASSVWTYTRP